VPSVTDWRVDLCRRSYAAWVAGDAEALIELYDPDCEWDVGPMAATGLGPVYRGHIGLRAMLGELTGAFEGFAPRILELRVFGEALLIRGDAIGTSQLMHVETATAPFGQAIEFKQRRILRVSQTEDPPPNWDEAQPVS
jgi:ketosteroid isomerase-like protein